MRPAASSTCRCWETACRDNPSPCFIVSRAQSSNSVWPSRSWSSSRIARLAGAASAWKTSVNAGEYRQVTACLCAAPVTGGASGSSHEADETKGADMKVFVAGATGVLGRLLVPQLVAQGHEVVGMTRSASKQDLVRGLGARPV